MIRTFNAPRTPRRGPARTARPASIAAGLTLLATSYVGYRAARAARAALDPVEHYRRGAASLADSASGLRLPVPDDRDDELTRLGHTLNEMLARLEAAGERERHELRTPLSLLRAELDVALHRPRTAAELTGTLRSVDTEIQRLIDLTNALLDLEQLGATEHLGRAPVDLRGLITSAVDPHRPAAVREHRTVTVDAVPASVDVSARPFSPVRRFRLGHRHRAVPRTSPFRLAFCAEQPSCPSRPRTRLPARRQAEPRRRWR
ncbi:histidine kinase dimerization/phospho-acceptor domain-containing protein [Streptomyces sp. NPDC007960]|uniref:histidine kinase dimerization/phospho-acceptor domain-containing protein n=1 Tax=Streptomyces sp. NPDC007960 TaxID=3364798 RepID=UPI0036E395EA